jgi:predicted HTH transcriptional regulator
MIEAAATMYCNPPVEVETLTHSVDGKTLLEVVVKEVSNKPIYALNEENKPRAYIRIDDENILATSVHLKMWQRANQNRGSFVTYTEKEQHLLNILKEKELLTLNQCCKRCKLNRNVVCNLLADFIRFELVVPVFLSHRFYFKLKDY